VDVVPSLQYSLPLSRLSPLLNLRRDERTLQRCIVINVVEVYAQNLKRLIAKQKTDDAQRRVAAGFSGPSFITPSLLVHPTGQASHYARSQRCKTMFHNHVLRRGRFEHKLLSLLR
jgi:hypothetical protein